MVGRRALHERGLPLLVGGRRQQPEPVSLRTAGRYAGQWRTAGFRGRGRNHRSLHLARDKSEVPAAAGRRVALVHLPAGALLEEVPRGLRDGSGVGGAHRPRTQLGGAAQPAGQHVPVQQPEPADLAALDEHHQAARHALQGRAKPLLPSGGRERAAVALHRPRHYEPGDGAADPGQGRRRRGGLAGARHLLQQLHVPARGAGAK